MLGAPHSALGGPARKVLLFCCKKFMAGRAHGMMMMGKTDDSAGAGRREYYTVLLEEGAMADVMAVYDMEGGEGLDTVYIMELEDGGTVYTYGSDGNSVGKVSDYGVSEKELIRFVLHYMGDHKKP